MNDNRRDSARSRVFMLVQVGEGGSHGSMWAHDIGLGGMLCRAGAARFVGTYLDLSFTLPGTDEVVTAGGQVTQLDSDDNGYLLGIRFCMLSRRAQMAIYRFLDRRRPLWDPKVVPAPKQAQQQLDEDARPFEPLLLEAFAALRAKELRRPTFVKNGPSRDLESLGRILGRKSA
jgi:hypothetical protein